MSTIDFLGYLRSLNVKVWGEGDQLKFSAPHGLMTQELRAELTSRKTDIIQFLQGTQAIAYLKPSRILRAPRDRDLPLSFSQERLWFLDQLSGPTAAYNIAWLLRLSGSLNSQALEQSLREIVRRHEVLRTTFARKATQVVQVIGTTADFSLAVRNLQEQPEPDRRNTVKRLVEEEARRPFDLARGPLFRCALFRLSGEEHWLVLTVHHIAYDGWSDGVLFRELSALYGAFTSGRPSSLEELPIQYADFAVWQRQWLQGEVLKPHIAFWKKQLEKSSHILELPTDRPRPPIQTFCGANHSFSLPPQLVKSIKALAKDENTTLFVTLLASFQTLLFRYTNQDDFLIGTASANRNRSEIQSLIGFFVNTLPLRADLSGNPTFRELLQRTHKFVLGAMAHQDLPFEKLVEVLEPERDMSRNPLFQVMFVLQNIPMEEPELPGLRVTTQPLIMDTTKFDATLEATEHHERIDLTLEYNTDLFDASTIYRLAQHFQALLEGIVSDRTRRISELPLLSEAERRRILVEWNGTAVSDSQAPCVHHTFEAQVARTPEATALALGSEKLTYVELNQRANQLARHLQGLGVKPQTRVGLYMERSIDMMVGLLGILKSGGAYLPLDPAYPLERLAYMLEDAQVPVLLTQTWLGKHLPKHTAQVVYLDAHGLSIAQASRENADSGVTAESLAYVIYTSGSTGKPKGVLISHGALANHCRDIQVHYQLSARDRVLQFASLNFDASLAQIFPPLSAGATLILRGTDILPADEFHKQVVESRLSVLNLPPAYWHEWAKAAIGGDNPKALRLVVVGGDVMSPETLHLWQQTPMKAVRLLNAYGPTETTITATTFEVPLHRDEPFTRIPIGRPLAHRTAYVLDREGHPVPVGVRGELHLGGAGLACGYLNQPQMTAQRFIPDPFGDHPTARLYKTGDLARYLPDGNIEYLGRLDNQVKLRGFRIELEEIETTLNQYAGIRDAVVLAREDTPGDKKLVAYVVCKGRAAGVMALRAFLRTKLPEYMVPSAFVQLDALPMTANGKIDRKALPKPEGSRPDLEKVFQAPRTPVEQIISDIWTQVIGLERVGVEDNFFDLGGHSLLATRVISRLREAFDVELSLRRFFESPTVDGLAKAILKDSGQRSKVEKRAEVILRLSQLSDEQVHAILNKKGATERSSKTP